MNSSTFKPFGSNTSLSEQDPLSPPSPSVAMASPSPPVVIPTQARQQGASSQVLVNSPSHASIKSYGIITEDNPEMPTLEPALRHPEPGIQQAVAAQNELPEGALEFSLSQELGVNREERYEYKSKEVVATIHRHKMLQNRVNGHTWDRKISVDVNKKKGVAVHALLSPRFSGNDNTESTVLFVTANLKKALLKRIRGRNERCWIKIDTSISDRCAGKTIQSSEGHPHSINTDDGQVNFHHVLAAHDQVVASTCKQLTLLLKATLIIAPITFKYAEQLDGDFAMVYKVC